MPMQVALLLSSLLLSQVAFGKAYLIGPKHTSGWLARVQQLANVVSDTGTIELNLFARAQ